MSYKSQKASKVHMIFDWFF